LIQGRFSSVKRNHLHSSKLVGDVYLATLLPVDPDKTMAWRQGGDDPFFGDALCDFAAVARGRTSAIRSRAASVTAHGKVDKGIHCMYCNA
jgi:hypothetical protein